MLGLDGNFASKDRVHHIVWTDKLVPWVPILVVVFVFLTVSILFPIVLDGVSLSGPLCVNAFEDTAFFYRVLDGVDTVLSAFWYSLPGNLAVH